MTETEESTSPCTSMSKAENTHTHTNKQPSKGKGQQRRRTSATTTVQMTELSAASKELKVAGRRKHLTESLGGSVQLPVGDVYSSRPPDITWQAKITASR